MKHVIAIDIGGTNLRTALIDENYKIKSLLVQATPLNNLEAFLAAVKKAIDELMGTNAELKINAIACGVPGRVDGVGGIEILPNIGIKNVPLQAFLVANYHLPVVIKNDAVMAAIAEGNLGFGKNLSSSYFITISTGIGAAFIADHQLRHSSEEVGHKLVPLGKEFEEFEKVVSGQGIVNLARYHGVEIKDAQTFFLRLGQHDAMIQPIFNVWLNYLTDFLKWVDFYYAPKAFIFTGGVMKSKQYFWAALQSAVPHIPLALAQFGQDAGLIGAANLALNIN
jgi:glucokinase